MRGGLQTITASGVVGSSGDPLVIYAVSVDSGATQSIPLFRNGTAATSAILFEALGTAARKVLVPNIPAEGLYFAAGCYLSLDGNEGADGVTVRYEHASIT
mgnify:CR=1 FL=1